MSKAVRLRQKYIERDLHTKGRARERGTLGETQTDRYRDKKRHKQI